MEIDSDDHLDLDEISTVNEHTRSASSTPVPAPGPSKESGRGKGRCPQNVSSTSKFDSGWLELNTFITQPRSSNRTFTEIAGAKNMPRHISAQSTAIDFLDLFLDDNFWKTFCEETNRRASQVKQQKPNSYYAKDFIPLSQSSRLFFGLRLQMEQCIKPRYEDHWASSSKSFVTEMPGFCSVMQRDRFLSIWTHLHFVNELNPTVDKTDKIYKVRPMLDMLLTKFQHFYSPSQCLSLDQGMIPCKGRLAIKQYIKSKPIKWGIKAYMACDSNTGYIMNLEIYTGKTDNVIPELGVVGSVVVRLLATGYLTNKNHIVYMDRFYNSVTLFDTLFNVYGTFAVGTAMTNRKFNPKELTKMKNESLVHPN
uniref:PiggyBac transposable element-derived protein domain-containing protein n=1 Tax=Biomphalaria glabrata TaxID=6526 RepID=A0A2C9K8Q1_BIOGL